MTELLILLKATLILVLGLTASALAKRCRASRRHIMLAATFGALWILPLSVLVLPAARMEIPLPRSPRPAMTIGSAPSQSLQTSLKTVSASPNGSNPGGASVATVLRMVWVSFTLALLLTMAVTHQRLRRIRCHALPWTGSGIEGLAKEAGIRKNVEVLLHSEIAAPMTFGFLRPAILMPISAPEWEDAELHHALVHELEHIRRGDWLVHGAAAVACALYWFLPLSWIAWRWLCLEAERSCDDAVLQKANAVEYADQLIQLARQLCDAAPSALAMAGRSDLSARVGSILDRTKRRGRVGWIPALASIVVSLVLVLEIAPVVPALVAASGPQLTGMRIRAIDRALIEAVQSGDLQDIVELLNAGADVNCAVDGDGSPLIVAARRGSMSAVQLLMEHGADVNEAVEGDGNPLIAASVRGHLEIVDLLLKQGARIEDVVPGDENALIQASASGRLNVVKLLVSRGANVNARVWADGVGAGEWRTPLSMAARGRHFDVVAFLRSAGATE
jgi:bla regulator protein blaR1